MIGKEYVKQLIVGNQIGIKNHFNRFGMAGVAGTNLLVVGVCGLSAGITDRGGNNAGNGI